MSRLHVLIVGAGIIGASVAWRLMRAGARVTVMDGGELGWHRDEKFVGLDKRQLGQS